MTSIVGIYCSDGIVIGADSVRTIANHVEQQVEKVVVFPSEPIIYVGTGNVGYIQRLRGAIETIWATDARKKASSHYVVGNLFTQQCLRELKQTGIDPSFPQNNAMFPAVSALVGFVHQGSHQMCWLETGTLQPVLYDDNLWYVSLGNNSHITNTFLSFIRDVFWKTGPPDVAEGIFAAVWTLRHVIQTNTGGVRGKPSIAVIKKGASKAFAASVLPDETIQAHEQAIDEAKIQLKDFFGARKQMALNEAALQIPKPPHK